MVILAIYEQHLSLSAISCRKPSLTCHLLLDDIRTTWHTFLKHSKLHPIVSMLLVTCSGWEPSHLIHHGTRKANKAFWKSHMLNKRGHDGMAISTKNGVKRTTAENRTHSLNTLGLILTRNLPMSKNLNSVLRSLYPQTKINWPTQFH